MAKGWKKSLLDDDFWGAEIRRLERRLRDLHGLNDGELAVYEVPRRGYRERKVRQVRDHTIKLIRPRGWVPPKRRRRG